MAVVAPDLHGNPDYARRFLAHRPDEPHIALGDYVDGAAGPAADRETLELLLASSATLLWGNHELEHLVKNPFALAGVAGARPGNDPAAPLTRLLEANRARLVAACAVDGWLLSHAGLHDGLVWTTDLAQLAARLNATLTQVLSKSSPRRLAAQCGLFALGPGSMGIPGGMFLLRAGAERGPSDRIRQLFGHTPHREPRRVRPTPERPFRDQEYLALKTYPDSFWVFDTSRDELAQLA